MSLHEFNRYAAVFMLSVCDEQWFSPRMVLKIAGEEKIKKAKIIV